MAFTFPEDKTDFTAPNGVTYHWDGTKWVTKTFKADESDFVKHDEFEADQTRQDDAFAADQSAQDQLIAANRRSIEELEVTKGPVSRYECKGTDFSVATRNGDLYVNDATAANVTSISFAAFDLNGNPTRPVSVGDIIEFVESKNLRNTGEVSRFRVTNGDDPAALEVAYLNGENNFEVGEPEEVYIYPQNEETASKEYVDNNFLPLSGGELSGTLKLKKGSEKTHPQWKISPNGGTDYATNIYSLEGPMRFRTSKSGNEGEHVGSHIVLDPDVAGGGADQTTKIYKVPMPNQPDMAASKAYVDQEVASVGGGGGGVPVGSIMIWLNSTVPDGWFKLQGGGFNVNTYPQLHAYLQGTSGYTSGKLPSWGGHYPGEYGDHLAYSLGSKQGAKTAKPSAGTPRSSASIPDGSTRGFNGAGGTNAYSNGHSKVSIDENWDSTTRPKTVVVHYIIKHD